MTTRQKPPTSAHTTDRTMPILTQRSSSRRRFRIHTVDEHRLIGRLRDLFDVARRSRYPSPHVKPQARLRPLTNWGARSQYERRLATLPVATQLRTRNRKRCRHPEQSHAGERESCNNERTPFAGPSCTFHCRRSCWFAQRIGAGEPFI